MVESVPSPLILDLYGTSGCHLCDDAEQVIVDVLNANPGLEQWVSVRHVDISECDELMASYAVRIPVLACQGTELEWPFDHQAFVNYVNELLRNAC